MMPDQKLKKRKASLSANEVDRVMKVKKLASGSFSALDELTGIDPKTLNATKPDEMRIPKLKGTKGVAIKNLLVENSTQILSTKPKPSKKAIIEEKEVKNVKSIKSLEEGVEIKKAKARASKSDSKISFDATEDIDIANLKGNSDDEELDDQTEALLKGFESDDNDEEDAANGYKPGEPIPQINKKDQQRAKLAAESSTSRNTGVIYLGRIPHGFYEHEMRQYFGQFGDILRLRLSRNRKTGRSKHFAFLEFKANEVAEIVAKTMDNYLLFGHIMKCKLVKPEQIHANLWKGANKRFKKVPWNKIEARKLEQGMTEQGWLNRIERERNRRAEKAQKLKDLDYEFIDPKLKSTKDIPKQQSQNLTVVDMIDGADASEATEGSQDNETADSALKISGSGISNNKRQRPRGLANKIDGDAMVVATAPTRSDQVAAPDDVVVEEAGQQKTGKRTERSAEVLTKTFPPQIELPETTEDDSTTKIRETRSKKKVTSKNTTRAEIDNSLLAASAPSEIKSPGLPKDDVITESSEKKTKKAKKRPAKSEEAESVYLGTFNQTDIEDDQLKPRNNRKGRKAKSGEA